MEKGATNSSARCSDITRRHSGGASREPMRDSGAQSTTNPSQSVNICNRRLTTMASSGFKIPYQRTGFVPFAESLNGRLAMLGFVIAIATEALSGKGILGQLGLG
jgi:ferrochelatase